MEVNFTAERFSLKQIFRLGWKYFKENAATIIPIYLLIYLPINWVLSLIPSNPEESIIASLRKQWHVSQTLEMLVGIIAVMALMKIIEAAVNGRSIGIKEAISAILPRWGASIWTAICLRVILMLGFLLFIIPGVFLYICFYFAIPAVALRKKSGGAALQYSRQLVRGQWCYVFVTMLVIGIANFVVAMSIGGLTMLLPDIQLLDIITDTIIDLTEAPFLTMAIILFLNLDYRAHPAAPPETKDAPAPADTPMLGAQ
ncbi:MAG: hypothetical protein PHQ27_01795 [Victivallales bacterium]|nr:hypothetical protein [Victivallales bacterium]